MTMQRLKNLRGWLIGVGVLCAVVAYVTFARTHWMPAPSDGLERYVCPDGKTTVHYRHHANTIRFETPIGMRVGAMHYDQIEWGDYGIAAAVLGVRPPSSVKYGDLHVLRLGGGDLNDVECRASGPAEMRDLDKR